MIIVNGEHAFWTTGGFLFFFFLFEVVRGQIERVERRL